MIRTGILLAGGRGTQLHPLTVSVSKQLLPVYDKPMIYYPLSTLMLAGMRRILVVTNPDHQPLYQNLLGDGSQWGIALEYAEQPTPAGLAHALSIGRDFLDNEGCCLILGDNILWGPGLDPQLGEAARQTQGATVFACRVAEPSRYGIVELDAGGRPVGIEEKPLRPRSHDAVAGIYFYDQDAIRIAASLRPSSRGEMEITDLNAEYLRQGRLRVVRFGQEVTWLDAGTAESLMDAARRVQEFQVRNGVKIGCPEETAYRMGYIDRSALRLLAAAAPASEYRRYLMSLLDRAP